MHNIKHEQSFPFDNNTLVVLKAKCPEGEAIIKQSGSHWIDLDVSNYAAGVYTYSLTVGNNIETKQMIVR